MEDGDGRSLSPEWPAVFVFFGWGIPFVVELVAVVYKGRGLP
jgi:hypothetical protein